MTDNHSSSGKQLARYTQTLLKACDDAGRWVDRNPDLLRNELDSMQKDLRKSRRILRKCAQAAESKMSAGVFGPSQAGKSYLISALARGANNQLMAKFGDQTYDFLSDINPEGGKESTGLVTRFTLTPTSAPEGYPVRLRLLSETDLVKIIANAYYSDFEHKEIGQSDIQKTLDSLRPGASDSPIDTDAMEDLVEYLQENFGGSARIKELERYYFDQAIALGPQLDLEGRVRLYSLIWDEVEGFTALLRKLLEALERLRNPVELFCSMDALIPRDASIIDVATLAELEEDTKADIAVRTPAGVEGRMPRSILTALTAELTIVMQDKPAAYFDHTDLLDFPGYRSRYSLPDARVELAKKGMLKELFLRGKVAYLFQRYCAERELNSMLLCIGPSNQEVQDLPGVIDDWIKATHGATAEDRIGKRIALLFVLTKFDMEFEDKKGASGSLEGRWDTRLRASLLNFFGLGHSWPAEWTPGKGFNNIFLLRNPNFKFDAVLNYAGDQETGIRPERAAFVEDLHKAFLQSPLVAAHIREPSRAWDEAMRLNDGGISYIREALNPLCDPAIKQEQLLATVNRVRVNMERKLAQFYKSDDKEELRNQKVGLTVALFQSLGQLVGDESKRFGQLLRCFTITDSFAYDLHREADMRYQAQRDKKEEQPKKESEEITDYRTVNLSQFLPGGKKDPAKNDDNALDEEAFYAAYIENKWVEKLHQLADNLDVQDYYKLDGKLFSALASELAIGAARLGYRDEMARQFRKVSAYTNIRRENILRKQAAIAAATLNQYIDWLGYSPVRDGPHTVVLQGASPAKVFTPRPEPGDMPKLADNPSPFDEHWATDWLTALGGLIMENVNFDGDQTLNVAENSALGAILAILAAQPPKMTAEAS